MEEEHQLPMGVITALLGKFERGAKKVINMLRVYNLKKLDCQTQSECLIQVTSHVNASIQVNTNSNLMVLTKAKGVLYL